MALRAISLRSCLLKVINIRLFPVAYRLIFHICGISTVSIIVRTQQNANRNPQILRNCTSLPKGFDFISRIGKIDLCIIVRKLRNDEGDVI